MVMKKEERNLKYTEQFKNETDNSRSSLDQEKKDPVERYRRIVPVFDYAKVYQKIEGIWRYLNNHSFQRGYLLDHIRGSKILGYTLKFSTTNFLIVDVDAHSDEQKNTLYDRVCEVIDTLGTSSYMYRSSKSGGVHIVYNFKQYYDYRDIRASARLALEGMQGIDIFPSKTQNMRLPLGQDTKIISKDLDKGYLEELNISHPDDILDHIEQYYIQYEKLTDLCKHVKTRKTMRKPKTKGVSKVELSTVSFTAGNRLHSLINIFNISKDENDFLKICDKYDKEMMELPNPSRDLKYLSLDQRVNHYNDFYETFISKRTHKKKKYDMVLSIPEEKKEIITKYLKYQIPQYHNLTKQEKINFLDFSMKVINSFYVQMNEKKKIYELPATYLKKINARYNKYWKILKPIITSVIKNYSNHHIKYHSVQYSILCFSSWFSSLICNSNSVISMSSSSSSFLPNSFRTNTINYSYMRPPNEAEINDIVDEFERLMEEMRQKDEKEEAWNKEWGVLMSI